MPEPESGGGAGELHGEDAGLEVAQRAGRHARRYYPAMAPTDRAMLPILMRTPMPDPMKARYFQIFGP